MDAVRATRGSIVWLLAKLRAETLASRIDTMILMASGLGPLTDCAGAVNSHYLLAFPFQRLFWCLRWSSEMNDDALSKRSAPPDAGTVAGAVSLQVNLRRIPGQRASAGGAIQYTSNM